MFTTKSAFADFDAALNLDPAERVRAQNRHRRITDVLKKAEVVEGTFLQGSFARKTMPKPLKDVDMVVLIHPRLTSLLQRPGGPAQAM